MSARRANVGRLRGWAAIVAVLCLSCSCTFLSDEFTWLDRAGPVAERAADAAVDGAADRP